MKKTSVRVIAIILVALLLLGIFSSAIAMLSFATVATSGTTGQIITADTTVSKTLTVGKVATGLQIKFNTLTPLSETDGVYIADDIVMPLDSSFGWSYNTTVKVTAKTRAVDNRSVPYYEVVVNNVQYNGGSTKALVFTLLAASDINGSVDFNIPISNKYFKESSSSGDEQPASDIVVMSTIVKDKAGNQLSTVDKDTPAFSVEVNFFDMGLKGLGKPELQAAKKYAYITSPTGFKLYSGSSGEIELVSTSQEYPRFRATFHNIASDGTQNTLQFRIQYDMDAYEKSIKGTGAATLYQVKTSSEDDTVAPLKPNIIVQEYSYGKNAIIAGSEFNLDIVFANTSKSIDVENVVMTVEPANGFIIAAASNTMYFPSMKQGETKPHSVLLRALPSGNSAATGAGVTTDYSVQVKFSYQYLSKKEYATGETSVKIAIPVIQLDRFAVGEITDYTQFLQVGGEGYISVPISNKGKSATLNITGGVVAPNEADIVSGDVNFGNLEAGKSSTIDLSIVINVPGEFKGEVEVSYEDEYMNPKKIRVPVSIMVEEPPPPTDTAPPVDPNMAQKPAAPALPSIILCSLGGLFIAAPIALYSIKRIKARGGEDINEDF